MLVSGNMEWAKTVYPYLPENVLVELVELLAAYRPKTMWTSFKPKFDPQTEGRWHFPFMGITDQDNFDDGEFEDWQELAEDQILRKHNLSQKLLTC